MVNQAWLDENQIPGSVEIFVPGDRCEWNSESVARLAGILARLHSAAPPPPDVSNSCWHPSSLEALEGCPTSVIHADVWQGNVIASTDGQLVLIDWEHAGIGHSVVDLAMLVSDCESDELLEAVLGGYSAHRSLRDSERWAIVPTIRHTVGLRLAEKKRLGRLDSMAREYQRLERASKLRL